MKFIHYLLLTVCLCSFPAMAEPVVVGEAVPEVSIGTHRGGELILQGDELSYKDWDSTELRGKTRVIYHLAARWGIEKLNARSVENLDQLMAHIPNASFAVTTILNSDDVTFGASGAAQNEFEKNRKLHPETGSEFVLDKKSIVQRAWNLKRKSSTLMIVDQNNQVLFFKDGKLSDEDHQTFLKTLERELQSVSSQAESSNAPETAQSATQQAAGNNPAN